MTTGLLPEGLRDRLPPEAESAAAILRAVLDSIAAYGYERVAPPLIEFEDELVGRLKAGRSRDLFRFTDLASQRTLALRPDITAQIGRIASTRMAGDGRPLRLCYGGPVLKFRATQLRPERELIQAGAELIGADSITAAIEVIGAAIEALGAAGVTGITLDLTLPDLVDGLSVSCWPLGGDELESVRASLDAKDAGALAGTPYLPLVTAAGPAGEAIARLRALHLGEPVEGRFMAVEAVAAAFEHQVRVTLDPTERHGFEYQSWLGFSLFADGVSGEAGRGGSYAIRRADGQEEPAIGFSLFIDPLIDAGLMQAMRKRIFIPLEAPQGEAARLRNEGWTTVHAIGAECDAEELRCSHRLDGGRVVAIQE